MALMFQRLARNFVKNGYFPTDSETLSRVLTALSPSIKGKMRILDPCAGEGIALSMCKQHLGPENTEAFGIEYEETRAWHAKGLLDRCIHANVQQCVFSKKSFGLLFLNPPYGDLVADKTYSGFVQQDGARLEKLFYQLTVSSLQWGGILALILPIGRIDKEWIHWISHHFDQVEIFSAPEQRFKQVVILGVRCEPSLLKTVSQTKAKLSQCLNTHPLLELPLVWQAKPYVVPAASSTDVKFFSSSLDARQLEAEIKHNPCLWPQFHQYFSHAVPVPKKPLMPLSQWHLALSLAAGQVSGVVHSQDGRTFIIKGDTYKEVNVSKRYKEDDEGHFTETTTYLDKFVPVIRAIDMTPQSDHFGETVTIR